MRSYVLDCAVVVLLCACGAGNTPSAPAPIEVGVAPVPSAQKLQTSEAPSAAPSATEDVGSGPCGKLCRGRPPPALVDALSMRAKQAHRCYDNALAVDKTLQGRVKVALKIGSDGSVCDARADGDPQMESVARCVAAYYRSNTFPAPEHGCADLVLPINFVPRDAGP